MLPVLNNILYYLNLVAVLHFQHENNTLFNEENSTVPILLKQIPPGPIVSGEVVKFICSVDTPTAKCEPGTETVVENEFSYEWEMYEYVEDSRGNTSGDNRNVNVVKLPGQAAEMELKFNDSVSTNPNARCDLVCIVNKNKQTPSSASIKLTFKPKDARKVEELRAPSSFKMLDVRSRAAYFSWNPPVQDNYNKDVGSQSDSHFRYEDIVGYIIEYKNGRGTVDWKNERVTRYEVKDGDTFAACISNLKPWTNYHFRIMSCTKEACSRPSLPIIVRTLEDLPSGPPQDVKATALDEKTLEISWKPPPRYTWNGSLLGYNVGLKRGSSSDDNPYSIHLFNPLLENLGNVNTYKAAVSDSSVPYKVVVQALNNVGSGPFSTPVTQKFPKNVN